MEIGPSVGFFCKSMQLPLDRGNTGDGGHIFQQAHTDDHTFIYLLLYLRSLRRTENTEVVVCDGRSHVSYVTCITAHLIL